jgi:hypothetical protein
VPATEAAAAPTINKHTYIITTQAFHLAGYIFVIIKIIFMPVHAAGYYLLTKLNCSSHKLDEIINWKDIKLNLINTS